MFMLQSQWTCHSKKGYLSIDSNTAKTRKDGSCSPQTRASIMKHPAKNSQASVPPSARGRENSCPRPRPSSSSRCTCRRLTKELPDPPWPKLVESLNSERTMSLRGWVSIPTSYCRICRNTVSQLENLSDARGRAWQSDLELISHPAI